MGKKYNRLRRDGTFLSHAELKGWDCKIKAPEVFEAATQIHNVCLHVFGGALNFDPVAQRSESDKEMRPKLINGVFTREDPRKILDWLAEHHRLSGNLTVTIHFRHRLNFCLKILG